MGTTKGLMMMPIVSKVYCSASEVVLAVRGRPNVANGGGFVVADCSQTVIFRVDGCGIIGKKDEMILRDGEGNALLLIKKKGSTIEALSCTRLWRGLSYDFFGSNKVVFTLKEPNNSCFSSKSSRPIRISVQSNNFEIRGDFSTRSCTIVNNSTGHLLAQMGVHEDVEQVMSGSDLYHVKIMPGIDQAFVFGVISVLDYMYDGPTRCS